MTIKDGWYIVDNYDGTWEAIKVAGGKIRDDMDSSVADLRQAANPPLAKVEAAAEAFVAAEDPDYLDDDEAFPLLRLVFDKQDVDPESLEGRCGIGRLDV